MSDFSQFHERLQVTCVHQLRHLVDVCLVVEDLDQFCHRSNLRLGQDLSQSDFREIRWHLSRRTLAEDLDSYTLLRHQMLRCNHARTLFGASRPNLFLQLVLLYGQLETLGSENVSVAKVAALGRVKVDDQLGLGQDEDVKRVQCVFVSIFLLSF